MSWVKLDDSMPDHDKITPLSDAAFRAYVTSICFSARTLTDGFLASRKAKELAGKPRVVQELVPGLWEPSDGGFAIHDYLKYNPTKEQVLAERDKAKSRMGGRRSPEVHPEIRPNSVTVDEGGAIRSSPRSSPRNSEAPLNNPAPSPIPDPSEVPEIPKPTPRSPARAVVVGFEQCFARLLSPTELELVKALEEEHPSERIEFALREAAALNKRSVRYVQRTCERIANDDSDPDGADSGFSASSKNPNGVSAGVRHLEQRESGLAHFRRTRELKTS